MSVPVTELKTSTIRELNEAANSTRAEVGTGTGGVSISSDLVLNDYLTQALCEWCETAWALDGTATLAAWTTGTRSQLKHSLTFPTGQGRLFAIRAMAMGSPLVALDRIALASLKANKPSFEFDATGTPIYFYEESSFVGVYPPPSADTAASFVGLAVPLPAGDGSGGTTATSYSFAPDDLIRRVIPVAAAILLAQKAFDDPSIFGRLDHLITRYVGIRDRYRSMLSEDLLAHMKMPEIQAKRR